MRLILSTPSLRVSHLNHLKKLLKLLRKGGLSNKYIVDIEGYYSRNFFIIKEIAFFNLQSNVCDNYFLKTSKVTDSTYSWLVNYYHRIPYKYGHERFDTVRKRLNEENAIFIVKDIVKEQILSRFTNNQFITLFACPAYNYLEATNYVCEFSKHYRNDHCAAKKVHQIAEWYGAN